MICEYSIFYRDDLIITIYVNDLLIIDRTPKVIIKFKYKFGERYRIKNMGPVEDYLGIQIIRNSDFITLS